MLRFILTVLLILFTASFSFSTPEVTFNIFNSSYVYDDENGSGNGNNWDVTQYTLTYIQDIFQPYFTIKMNDMLAFKLGAGFLIDFNQESKVDNYYPYISTTLDFGESTLTVGSIDNNHNMPAPLMDEASSITPNIRITNHNHMMYSLFSNVAPNEIIEYNPTINEDTCGFYQYGGSLNWNTAYNLSGELYMNWQEMDISNALENHRERFDCALIESYELLDVIPLYGVIHYWHNGGHETPHPVPVTENYTAAFGLRNTNIDILYMASEMYFDRDIPSFSTFGQAIYIDYHLRFGNLDIQPEFWVNDTWIIPNNHFISVEGDPYFNTPLYAGINFYYNFYFDKEKTTLCQMGFVNGTYITSPSVSYSPDNIRNDFLLRVNFQYSFDIIKENS